MWTVPVLLTLLSAMPCPPPAGIIGRGYSRPSRTSINRAMRTRTSSRSWRRLLTSCSVAASLRAFSASLRASSLEGPGAFSAACRARCRSCTRVRSSGSSCSRRWARLRTSGSSCSRLWFRSRSSRTSEAALRTLSSSSEKVSMPVLFSPDVPAPRAQRGDHGIHRSLHFLAGQGPRRVLVGQGYGQAHPPCRNRWPIILVHDPNLTQARSPRSPDLAQDVLRGDGGLGHDG